MAIGVGGSSWDDRDECFTCSSRRPFNDDVRKVEYASSKWFDLGAFSVDIPDPIQGFKGGNKPENIRGSRANVEVLKYKTEEGELVRVAYCKENKTLYLEKK